MAASPSSTPAAGVPVPRYTLYGTNLTDEHLGSRVIFATDEFFAVADNLLKRPEPVFDPTAYCSQGKVMDGWESRRRRTPGHDWCVIRLAYRGCIAGIELDTAYFTGNYAPTVSIEAANIPQYASDEHDEWMPGSFDRFERGGGIRGSKASTETIDRASSACQEYKWHTIVDRSPLKPGYEESRMHYFAILDPTLKRQPFTHLRLNYFPDGGVARLKVYGSVSVNFEQDVFAKLKPSQAVPLMDLASMALGGRGLACSNKHFGVPRNLLKPGRGLDMGDGWETARHMQRPEIIRTNPETGLVDTDLGDWCILQLGTITASIERLEIDTRHFKGNFPESILVEAGCARNTNETLHDENADSDDVNFDDLTIHWFPLLNRTKLGPDKNYVFELMDDGSGEEEEAEANDAPSSSMGRSSSTPRLNPPYVDAPYISHIRVSIYPDGGISRVRVFGRPKRMERGMQRVLSGLQV
mmetsp:Transcript_18913/g.45668  ORF Transcript_18913/g.45668 Transcript_18913/m.45668 type:complete len:469 (-) Transcript_18913:108-1514(-)